jgi:DNA polymerase-3 subunit delta
MYFLIYGEDTYRSRKTLARMEAKFRADRDATGLNSIRMTAKKASIDEVAEALFATPFLSEKKLVVLEGFLDAPKDTQEALAGFLERKPDSTTVIFYDEGGAEDFKKSVLFPVLKDAKFTTEHAALSPAQAAKQVQQTCKEHGITMSPRALQNFLAAVGNLSWQRETELEKLCSYAAATGAQEITEQMVKELVPAAQEEDLFAFIDACLAGRSKDAVTLLESALASGASEIQITAMLGKQFRNLIAVRDCFDRGLTDKNLVAKAVGMHPFPAAKALQACRKFSPEALQAFHGQLLDIEHRLKTTSGKSAVLLEVFTARLTAA